MMTKSDGQISSSPSSTVNVTDLLTPQGPQSPHVDIAHSTAAAQMPHDQYMLPFDKPNQPDNAEGFPVHIRNITDSKGIARSKKLTFQTAWFKRFPWLHYCGQRNTVLCFYCAKASERSLLALYANAEDTFLRSGFTDWNKAIEKFGMHEKTPCHVFACTQVNQLKAPPVNAQVSSQKANEQAAARTALMHLVKSVRYLARQGLPLRGHVESNGNFQQLLQLLATNDKDLSKWIQKTTNFTSPLCQNELLDMMSKEVIYTLTQKVRLESNQFAVIVDGTQDCAGQEQESICIRYVDSNLNVNEAFMGFYNPPDTTGKTLSRVVLDALTRLSLPLAQLRAQTYDGAANMLGAYNGCQAFITNEQPLALFFHCSAHCANLVADYASTCNSLVKDTMQLVQDLSSLNSRSGKFKNVFHDTDVQLSNATRTHSLKPLCPTRWLTRVSSVTSVIDHYETVLTSLEMMAAQKTDTGCKSRGLLEQFNKGSTVLGLQLIIKVFTPLEQLNRSLQAQSATTSGMLQAVDTVVSELSALRSDQEFHAMINHVNGFIQHHDLCELSVPRVRRPPQRYCGTGEPYTPATAEEHYRPAYFSLIDSVTTQLNERFNKNANGLRTYQQLESMLLSGVIDDAVCGQYPELIKDDLLHQLAMFRRHYDITSLSSAQNVMQSMSSEVRLLFSQVEQLVRLMLVCPVTSCTAERSFSSLRRLKTWLRTTMSQTRLNSVAVCNIHQDILDDIDIAKIAKQFAAQSDIRKGLFGNWP